jgi:hypothetical protein
MECNYQDAPLRADGSASGKAVTVIHVLGDHLWLCGPRSSPPLFSNPIATTATAATAATTADDHDPAASCSDLPAANGGGSIGDTAPVAADGGDASVPAAGETQPVADGAVPDAPTAESKHDDDDDALVPDTTPCISPQQMDELLDRSLLQALKTHFAKPTPTGDGFVVDLAALPVSASTLYSNHMQSCRPSPIDIKRSSYKKVVAPHCLSLHACQSIDD